MTDRALVSVRDRLLPHQTDGRESFARRQLQKPLGRVPFIACVHPRGTECHCRSPGLGLIERATEELALRLDGGWMIGGDPSVAAGRGAGLGTIRLGPPSAGPPSLAPAADYAARDLLDAANWLLLREALAGA